MTTHCSTLDVIVRLFTSIQLEAQLLKEPLVLARVVSFFKESADLGLGFGSHGLVLEGVDDDDGLEVDIETVAIQGDEHGILSLSKPTEWA